MVKKQYLLLIFLSFTLIFSCKEKHDEYHSVMDKIEAKSIQKNRDTITNNLDYSNLTEVTDANPHFFIKKRKGQIASYACSECHSKPLKDMQSANGLKKAHWDIELKHANFDVMNCVSCHDDNNLDNLKNNTGKLVDFDKSYQLCMQCHNKEVADWKGGAHGKNISGWESKRVSKLCVECHNPHNPGFASKWPERYNTQMAEERK